MNKPSTDFLERFTQPSKRFKATHDLATLEEEAFPILHSLFSGEAINQQRIAYNRIGIVVDCALVVIGLLGEKAHRFEEVLQEYASQGGNN